MKEEINSKPQTKPSYKGQYGGARIGSGRKKKSEEEKKQTQKDYRKKWDKNHRKWQADTTEEIMDKSAILMKYLNFKNKHQLLEYFIEKANLSIKRNDKIDLFKDL